MSKKLERITSIQPAFDKRNPDPKINYGIGGATVRMVVKGPKGAVQFLFSTGIHTPEVHKELMAGRDTKTLEILMRPMGYDVGYHSPHRMYKGQTPMDDKCKVLSKNGSKCYYDGSGLRAEQWMDVLIRKGSDEIWKMLEEEYVGIFEKKRRKTVGNVGFGELLNGLAKAVEPANKASKRRAAKAKKKV